MRSCHMRGCRVRDPSVVFSYWLFSFQSVCSRGVSQDRVNEQSSRRTRAGTVSSSSSSCFASSARVHQFRFIINNNTETILHLKNTKGVLEIGRTKEAK